MLNILNMSLANKSLTNFKLIKIRQKFLSFSGMLFAVIFAIIKDN